MADLAVSIISDALRVAPGNGVSFVVEVRNLGSVVALRVQGEDALLVHRHAGRDGAVP